LKTFEEAIQESTCQKRITVCEIYDADGKLLSRESNRCSPEGDVCCRLGVIQTKDNYDKESSCNWIHAEIMAINALKGGVPENAILYGHDFLCDNCEEALKGIGVKVIKISNKRLQWVAEEKG